ncbi:MAG: hypothetical protein KatS3mg057_2655 [Herpetosiphonaceae bacterium]|nr:MAG: hypothetical protein KatS3mg057_2655 [Herpetosiphonaceae bacterium]
MKVNNRSMLRVFSLVVFVLFIMSLISIDDTAAVTSSRVKLVGIGYETWFDDISDPSDDGDHGYGWSMIWDIPSGGIYDSSDSDAIVRHAQQLYGANVDFILIDWSNNITCQYDCQAVRPDLYSIEVNTQSIFDAYKGLSVKPKIAILLGINSLSDATDKTVEGGTLTKLRAKSNQVYDSYAGNSDYQKLYQQYEGKPLLIIYAGTPSLDQDSTPNWVDQDNRFTVRWMSGFIESQPNLLGNDSQNIAVTDDRQGRRSKFGYWSWWDRQPETYTMFNTQLPEVVTVSAAYQGQTGWARDIGRGRENGQTFKDSWNRAYNIDPRIVIVNSWNEWIRNQKPTADTTEHIVGQCPDNLSDIEDHSEEVCPEYSNDIEPSISLGSFYLDLLTTYVKKFKSLRSDLALFDTSTGVWKFRNGPDYYYETLFNWAPATGEHYEPITGDFNKDNYGDIGVRNSITGEFFFRLGPYFDNQSMYNWGPGAGSHYKPFTGDFDGDGYWDIGLYDHSIATFYFKLGPDYNNQRTYIWQGVEGGNHQPITGDFNADGYWDIGLRATTGTDSGFFYFRTNDKYITTTSITFSNQSSYNWSAGAGSHYKPFTGDFDGDGYWDIGLYNQTIGTFYLKHGPSFTDQVTHTWLVGSNFRPATIDIR